MEEAREARRKKIMNRGTDRLAFITGQSRSLPPPTAVDSYLEENATGSATPKSQETKQIFKNKELPMNSSLPEIETSNSVSRHGSVLHRSDQAGNNRATRLSQINSSISATENIRLIFSVVIALLVILSCQSVISFKPFLLVLLSDLTLIFGRVFVNQELKGRESDGRSINIGSMLEAAILFQKVASVVFMDCSICAVIMISGIIA